IGEALVGHSAFHRPSLIRCEPRLWLSRRTGDRYNKGDPLAVTLGVTAAMAEPSTPPAPPAKVAPPPALPSTADTAPYVPVSWMAVAAAAVAILFVLVLIGSGYGAYRAKRPLIAPQILVFPAVAIVLSFAARRLIRDSEGTRTGELFGANLPNVAWWIGLVGILGYGTYLFAIDFSIRRDAEAEVTKWVDLIRKKDDPTAPDPVELAFIRTLEPGRRAAFTRITNRAELHSKLQAEMRDGLIAFQQTDLI